MDVLQFVAAMADALAWPAAVVSLVLIFRKQLASLTPGLRKLKYRDLEVEFEKELAAVGRQLPAPASSTHQESEDEASDYYHAVGETSPRASIIEAWIGLESTAVSSAKSLQLLRPDSQPTFPKWIGALREAELLSSSEAEALVSLRRLRNQAAHDWNLKIGQPEIDEYIRLARKTAEAIAARAWERMPKNC